MSTKRFSLKRYIQVKNSKIIDTTLILPHIECYFVLEEGCGKPNKLYAEMILGEDYYLGEIVKETDNLQDCTEGYLEFE